MADPPLRVGTVSPPHADEAGVGGDARSGGEDGETSGAATSVDHAPDHQRRAISAQHDALPPRAPTDDVLRRSRASTPPPQHPPARQGNDSGGWHDVGVQPRALPSLDDTAHTRGRVIHVARAGSSVDALLASSIADDRGSVGGAALPGTAPATTDGYVVCRESAPCVRARAWFLTMPACSLACRSAFDMSLFELVDHLDGVDGSVVELEVGDMDASTAERVTTGSAAPSSVGEPFAAPRLLAAMDGVPGRTGGAGTAVGLDGSTDDIDAILGLLQHSDSEGSAAGPGDDNIEAPWQEPALADWGATASATPHTSRRIRRMVERDVLESPSPYRVRGAGGNRFFETRGDAVDASASGHQDGTDAEATGSARGGGDDGHGSGVGGGGHSGDDGHGSGDGGGGTSSRHHGRGAPGARRTQRARAPAAAKESHTSKDAAPVRRRGATHRRPAASQPPRSHGQRRPRKVARGATGSEAVGDGSLVRQPARRTDRDGNGSRASSGRLPVRRTATSHSHKRTRGHRRASASGGSDADDVADVSFDVLNLWDSVVTSGMVATR